MEARDYLSDREHVSILYFIQCTAMDASVVPDSYVLTSSMLVCAGGLVWMCPHTLDIGGQCALWREKQTGCHAENGQYARKTELVCSFVQHVIDARLCAFRWPTGTHDAKKTDLTSVVNKSISPMEVHKQ